MKRVFSIMLLLVFSLSCSPVGMTSQPTAAHAVEMVNAAVKGGVPWVRLNYYSPNQMYDPKAPPVMFPEQQDRMLEQTIANCAKELLKK